jgi:hypothetical protein
MEFARFGCNRDPIVPELDCNDWRGRTSINSNLRLLETIYWSNDVHAEGTDAAFKTVGWHFELGVNVSKYVDLFYEHHSRHVMDQGNAVHISHDGRYRFSKFPIEDSYGIRLIFYESGSKRKTLADKFYP